MSASNWRQCPACLRKAKAAHEELAAKALASYGKVPADEYRAMSDAAMKPVELDSSLREDYQLGIGEDGRFYVHYRGSCTECPFEFRYKHEQAAEAT